MRDVDLGPETAQEGGCFVEPAARCLTDKPKAANSSGAYPAPTPRMRRPPEIMSTMAPSSATLKG